MAKQGSLKLAEFPQNPAPERILLGPGPSMVHPRVLQAMSAPLVGHLDPSFIQLMDRIQALLRYVFQTENTFTIPVPGTGSAAMEAAIANTTEPGDPVLVCINGYFGTRMEEMFRRYGAQVEAIHRPWGEIFDPSEIRQALEARKAKIVAIVHAETSTGARQPLEQVARIAHEHEALLLVDAVTSLGGMPVGVDEIGIDVCYSGSQKCLGVPPGLGPITFGPRAEAVMEARKAATPAWYLDLSMIRKYWGPERNYHHTAPITANFALYEGLRMLLEEGLEARWERHQRNAELLWEGLEGLDLQLHVPRENRLASLTTVRIPEGVSDLEVRKRLLEEYNIEISGGLGELKGKIWRIGLMGYSSRRENVVLLLGALERILHS